MDISNNEDGLKADNIIELIENINVLVDFQIQKTKRIQANEDNINNVNNTGSEADYNTTTVFKNFFKNNEDFVIFSNKFQIAGWRNSLENPNQYPVKLKQVIEKYLGKMLEVN